MSLRNRSGLNAGFAQVKITPSQPLRLAGISANRLGRRTRDDLFAKAMVFELRGRRIVLVSLDLLWIGREFCDTIRAWGQKELGLDPSSILVATTHTHGGPQAREFTFDGCDRDAEYLSLIQERAREAIREAVSRLAPVLVRYGTGMTEIAVNRRRQILDWGQMKRFRIGWQMANRPNFKGPRDAAIGAIRVEPLDGETPVTIIVNAACHPSIFRGEMYSGDFPGLLAGELSRREGRVVHVLFLQGFSGNLRSSQVVRSPLTFWPPSAAFAFWFDRIRFRKDSSEDHLKTVVFNLGRDIEAIRLRELDPDRLESEEVEIRLPLEAPPSRAYFEGLARSENPIQSSFGRFWLEAESIPEEVPLRLLSLSLGSQIGFLGVEGEVFCEYSLWLRKLVGSRMVLPVGVAVVPWGTFLTLKVFAREDMSPTVVFRCSVFPPGFPARSKIS